MTPWYVRVHRPLTQHTYLISTCDGSRRAASKLAEEIKRQDPGLQAFPVRGARPYQPPLPTG